VEYPVGQASHLGMAALSGVVAQGIREGGYFAKCIQRRSAQGASAELTARRVVTERVKAACFAEGTDQRARLRSQRRTFHLRRPKLWMLALDQPGSCGRILN